MKTRFVFLAALLGLTFPFISHAQIPRTLSYQGVLTDNAGKPRPDGNYTFKFCLYGSNTGGSPIWCESKNLPVKNGLFATVLGEQTPFGAAVKFDKQYWLGIQVGNESELSPRMALTSVGYSFSSLRADTASVSVASLADTTWRHSGANIYRLNGKVGIGTPSPTAALELVGGDQWTDALWRRALRLNNAHAIQFDAQSDTKFGIGASSSGNSLYFFTTNTDGINSPPNYQMALNADGSLRVGNTQIYDNEINRYNNDNLYIGYRNTANTILQVKSGNVGIGTSTPSEKLHIAGSLRLSGNHAGSNRVVFADENGVGKEWELYPSAGYFHIYNRTDGITPLTILNGGNVGIGTGNPTTKLHVEGTTTTKVLAITGGMDLAEPFEISENQPIPKGALVIIDEENPGQLKLSHQAYDKRVAGVVSGAGGINPGLTLTQEGVLEGGQNVALAGRVYALATAANGPIKPGDLLTTSEVAGHAMKAMDRDRWDGAVIGKAMSALEKGEGLVLVLVNLQ